MSGAGVSFRIDHQTHPVCPCGCPMDEEKIFLAAVELQSGDARDRFLDEACATRPGMRADVESLLRHHDAASRFLEAPPAELQATLAPIDGDTLSDGRPENAFRWLTHSEKPGCLGTLGSYEVLDILGRGGMGVVFKALDPKLNRVVALKVMNDAFQSSSQGRQRFLREAQAAAAVKHENLVTIHAVHDEGPAPYLVMEYVEGQSLERRLKSGPALEAEEIARIGIQIASGLQAAHQRGLVHRDVKPANILLETGTDRVKITDFGLARALDQVQLTQAGELAGTPQYMSPEQARGEQVDHRSDLFSLGSLLYTLGAGRLAFPAETAVAALRGICDDRPPPLRVVNPRMPAWLSSVVERLMEKQPQRRPQTAREAAELLQVRPSSPPSPPDRRRRLSLAAGALATLLFAGVVVVVTRGDKSTRVEVPDGSTVRVTKEGQVLVELPAEPTGARPVAPPTAPPGERSPIQDLVANLTALNAGFDGQATPTTADGQVVELELIVDQVRDISPLRGLTKLRRLALRGSGPGSGALSDLSPLKGLPLESLVCIHTPVVDVSPLEGMPLRQLQLQGTQVASLEPLRKAPLVDLNISFTRVTDLGPLRGMKLDSFYCDATRVADLTPLAGMPLKNLNWRGYDHADPRHRPLVESLRTLETIDGLSPVEFWQEVDAR